MTIGWWRVVLAVAALAGVAEAGSLASISVTGFVRAQPIYAGRGEPFGGGLTVSCGDQDAVTASASCFSTGGFGNGGVGGELTVTASAEAWFGHIGFEEDVDAVYGRAFSQFNGDVGLTNGSGRAGYQDWLVADGLVGPGLLRLTFQPYTTPFGEGTGFHETYSIQVGGNAAYEFTVDPSNWLNGVVEIVAPVEELGNPVQLGVSGTVWGASIFAGLGSLHNGAGLDLTGWEFAQAGEKLSAREAVAALPAALAAPEPATWLPAGCVVGMLLAGQRTIVRQRRGSDESGRRFRVK